MLSEEQNELLTRVGPGTSMGELLRHYWFPVGCYEWLTAKPQHLKLLGEELGLYRGADGKPGLMELRCAHRGVALDYGRVEGECLRCPYHGWFYDRSGRAGRSERASSGPSLQELVPLGESYQRRENGSRASSSQ